MTHHLPDRELHDVSPTHMKINDNFTYLTMNDMSPTLTENDSYDMSPTLHIWHITYLTQNDS